VVRGLARSDDIPRSTGYALRGLIRSRHLANPTG